MQRAQKTTGGSRWYMPGTEGTDEYVVPFVGRHGSIGIRQLYNGVVRVRIEPWSSAAIERLWQASYTSASGWKQPGEGGERRFSRVFGPGERREARRWLLKAIWALSFGIGWYSWRRLRVAWSLLK